MASQTRLYVGGLDAAITERDLRDDFERYGPLRSVWIARKPPGFAFIEYEDVRDAEDAVRKMDGYQGWRVEFTRAGPRGSGPPGGGYGGYGGPPMGYGYGPPPSYYGMRGPPGGRDQLCYNCGMPGHLARECRAMIGDLQGSRRSPPRRRYSRSRSRSRDRYRRSYSRDRYRSRSRSRRRDSRSRSRSRARSDSPRDKSRSRTPASRSPSPARSRSPAKSVSKSRSRSRSKS